MTSTESLGLGDLAVAIPAYRESDGIGGFLEEIDRSLRRWPGKVSVFLQDDASPDTTLDVIESIARNLEAQIVVESNTTNMGHGPTVLSAYRRALASGAEYIFQVDGDGQFEAEDFWALHAAIRSSDVAVGVRENRADPWFRKVLSRLVRVYLRIFFGGEHRDANCPFRLYRASALGKLMPLLPDKALVPTIYLAVASERCGLVTTEVVVRHRVRRGASSQGTMWGQRRALLVPRRLVLFSIRALRESFSLRSQLLSART